ncbi:hypothetical protein [Hymenobacter convexus]|uniref:hypothetical protein n=1 Tax=Hymenobacter sp. CA1UV-4 TaxID=3063782 RepID=UPI0027133134|nr:hypothetical protein [Hymenobacter sp. CA1UV-4]MDO7853366.1 hypothetical protein [Hymenobacter sp. CA1UV-4]
MAGALLPALFLSPAPAMGQARALSFSAETAQGQYQDDVVRQSSSNSILCTFCGSGYSVRRMGYYHDYTLAGVAMAYDLRPKSATGIQSVGIGLRGGRQRTGFRPLAPGAPFEAAEPPFASSLALYDLNPYLEGRARLWGLDLGYRAGLHLGQLRYTATVAADSSLRNDWLAPDAELWVGVRRVLFAQVDAGTGMLALGNHTSRFALGTGLGADDGRHLLAGLAVARHESGYGMGFLSARIPLLRSRLLAEPYVATNFSRHHQLHFCLSYQLPLNE